MTGRPVMPDTARTIDRSVALVMRLTGCSHRQAAGTVRQVIHVVISGYEEASMPAPAWLVSLRLQAALEEQKDNLARTGSNCTSCGLPRRNCTCR